LPGIGVAGVPHLYYEAPSARFRAQPLRCFQQPDLVATAVQQYRIDARLYFLNRRELLRIDFDAAVIHRY
jgi:hypothetical protein